MTTTISPITTDWTTVPAAIFWMVHWTAAAQKVVAAWAATAVAIVEETVMAEETVVAGAVAAIKQPILL
jgi:hypothetical protein